MRARHLLEGGAHEPGPDDVAEPCLPNVDNDPVHVFPPIKQRDGRAFAYKFGRPLRPKDKLVGTGEVRPEPARSIMHQLLFGLGEASAKRVMKQALAANTAKNARWLLTQPDSCDPQYYSHFDCWCDDEEDDTTAWPLRGTKARRLVRALVREWTKGTKCDFTDLEPLYLKSINREWGQVPWFELVGARFVSLGYYVYLSDSMFEVYAEEHISDEEKQDATLTWE